jgi:thiamine pyrophosphate-dependent acetolactate synthase large subunit-like protein
MNYHANRVAIWNRNNRHLEPRAIIQKTKKNTEGYSVSMLLWNYLKEQGITNIFGITGVFVYKILHKIPGDIYWNNVGNELFNGFTAQVYGQYMNNVGVLFTTSGPGLATALSAVKNAVHEGNPLLLITGHNKNAKVNDFQNINFTTGLGGISNYIIRVDDPMLIVRDVNIAYQLAKNLNTGVILSIEVSLESENVVPSYYLPYTNMIMDTPTKIAKIQNTIRFRIPSTSKLLIILGKGNFEDTSEVISFITNNNLPYVTTWKGRCDLIGGINCGRIGTLGNHSANYAAYHATHILIVGNLSGGMTDASIFYKNKFSSGILNNKTYIGCLSIKEYMIDSYSTEPFIVSNIENILKDLVLQTTDAWRNQLQTSNDNLYVDLSRKSLLEEYCYAAAQIYNNDSNVRAEVSVATGVGNHWLGIGKYMNIQSFNKWHSPTSWCSIGVGVANGYGMYLAQKKPVWVFEGDGGALFSSSSILHLISQQQFGDNIPMTITIFIDNYYSAVVAGYTINGYIPDSDADIGDTDGMNTNKVPTISWTTIIPSNMLKEFDNVIDYQTYLSANPISPELRFILLKIPNYSESSIYEINYNNDYTSNLVSSNYQAILGTPMVLKYDN